MALEHLHAKGLGLQDISDTIIKHRREDLGQLSVDQLEAGARWEERLKRLEQWMAGAAKLRQSAGRLSDWRDSARWFDRAQSLLDRYSKNLEVKAARLEKDLIALSERIQQWSDRLTLKEVELRRFMEKEAVSATEILVSSARKRPYLEFVYAEREEEGNLSRQLKSLRGAINLVLERLKRARLWAENHAAIDPARFEIQKGQLFEAWGPAHRRFAQIREAALNLALSFEEGRPRLRWIYDKVQKMRVVQETQPRRRPLLERFFNINLD